MKKKKREYPLIKCLNKECNNKFKLICQNLKQKYCSKKCLGKANSIKNTKTYPKKICENPECKKEFQIKSKDTNKKYCSRPCANSWIGKNSKLGEFNKGKTPPEGSGRCKWYIYNSKLAGEVKVQGTWELRFANCLDNIGKTWRTNHNKDRFYYLDENGLEKSYSPDFFSNGEYFEIKGYEDNKCKHKLNEIRKQNIKLKIVYWKDLKELETKLFGKPLSGVNTLDKVINNLQKVI